MSKWTDYSKEAWGNAWKFENIGGSIGTIVGGIGDVVSAGVSNSEIKDTSSEESAIKDVAATQFSSGNLDSLLSQFDSSVMSRTNYTGSELRGLTTGQQIGNTFKGMASGAMAGAKIGGPWGALVGSIIGFGRGAIGSAIGNKKAKDKAVALNKKAKDANASYLNSYSNSVENTQNTMFNNSLLNIASYGGPLHELSGDWTNGLTFINEGGTHEQNPFEGVQIGVDPQGIPNLVEEGEVIYNNYVFSNRLKPTKKQLEDSGLNMKYEDWTFAKIVEDLQKESADSPIDFISQNTLKDMISIVTNMQEEIRMKKNKTNNRFDGGGPFASKEEELEADRIQAEEDARMNALSDIWANSLRFNKGLDLYFPTTNNTTTQTKNKFNWQSLGRYAPVVADTATLLNNVFTKPDYSNANAGVKAMRDVPMVDVTPIGNYIQLDNIDKNYYLNPILSTSRGTARAIQNQGLNAGQTQFALLANQHELNKATGNALMEMERENMARDLQEAQFKLGIDQYNANRAMQAKQMNQQRAFNIAQAEANAAKIREAIDAQRAAAISQSLSGLSEGLAGIGTESVYRDWLGALTDTEAIKDVFGAAANIRKTKKACGGKLLTKKRK